MKRVVLLCLLMLLWPMLPARAAAAEHQAGPRPEMTTYYVGFLMKGPAWTVESTPEVERIQQGHMAHIQKMAESGKLLLAGPFSDDGKLRGMFVFAVDTMEEAMALASEDPAIEAGRLVIEMHPWFSVKGIRVEQHQP